MSIALTFDNLTLAYERHPAVHHLSGSFAPGSLTAVTGPNGGGKSTLLKGIAGLIRPIEGHGGLTGAQIRDIAYLPQRVENDADFPIRTLDVVLFGCWRQSGSFAVNTQSMQTKARAAMAAMGLEGFEDRAFGSLSVGQRQRALFARVLVSDSPLILLDEPFAALDARSTQICLDMIRKWHDKGRTIIAVLHDFEQVRAYFPETLLLARETIAWGPTDDVLTEANLARARAMSEAWDVDADICVADARKGAA